MSKGAPDMRHPLHLDPEQPAPVAGSYRAHNVLGVPIEEPVPMREGELLPPLPKGFTWVLIKSGRAARGAGDVLAPFAAVP